MALTKQQKAQSLSNFYAAKQAQKHDYQAYMSMAGWKKRVAAKKVAATLPAPTHGTGCGCQKCDYLHLWAATSNATTTTYNWGGGTGSTTYVTATWDDDTILEVRDRHVQLNINDDDTVEIPKRTECFRLPDGTLLRVDGQGNFQLDDANAQVIYKANRNREFNPYLNASDLLARFVKYVGALGVPAGEILSIPTSLFVQWLVLEAAQQDGDAPPADVRPLPESRLLRARLRPQCQLPSCRRFLQRERAGRYPYCSPDHGAAHGALLLAG